LKNIILSLFFIFCLCPSYAQSAADNTKRQNKIDSLKQLYFKGEGKDLHLLVSLLHEEPSPDSMLKYGRILLNKSYKDSSHLMTFNGFLHLGNGHAFKGELSQALE
jgi:hypothetical protein